MGLHIKIVNLIIYNGDANIYHLNDEELDSEDHPEITSCIGGLNMVK
ncbi:MAG: hypothetical protein ACYCYE_11835 [Clostridia bacterium]